MPDFFDEIITCNKCGKKMVKNSIIKNGFSIRTLECKKCGKKIYHPADIQEYKRFSMLKQRPFSVKLRMVGNSYTVSIPREIINFQREMHKEMKKQVNEMNEFVRLCLEGPRKLSLMFEKAEGDEEKDEEGGEGR